MTAQMHGTTKNLRSISLNITATSFYRPSAQSHSNISSIPPMVRRRLSPLARMVFQVASVVQPKDGNARFVFGSRHGEITSCLNMLESLAEQQTLSPAAFSHSVHNAIPGLWSIYNREKSESSAIAAGKDTFAIACLEAQLMLADDPKIPVILVLADEKLPALFEQFEHEPTEPYALALLIESGSANLQLNASTFTQAKKEPINQNLPALDWHNWWCNPSQELEQAGERHMWIWQKLSCH